MANNLETKREKLVSAVSLWRTFDTSASLESVVAAQTTEGKYTYDEMYFNGHRTSDGCVRVYADFARPVEGGKFPAVLVLGEAGKTRDRELLDYFLDKGYAVLMPDYAGRYAGSDENRRTVYPKSLSYANYGEVQGLYDLKDRNADETCWYEWTYVALYAIEYLRLREDITGVGIVGIRTGGEIAWKAMLSPHVKCGIAINAAGWLSYRGVKKFAEGSAVNLKDERHRYIAGVESQSYAPFVKKPMLMMCALSDYGFDYDRAYDTYSRIGGDDFEGENAIVYSPDSGSCIGAGALTDMDLFLQKHLKGREIYIPSALNITVTQGTNDLAVSVEGDEEGLVEEIGVCYAEADTSVNSVFREWQCVYRDCAVKKGKTSCKITPFSGATAAYVYAYARYINGFQIVSKIVAKKFVSPDSQAAKSRVIFAGEEIDCFCVENHEDYSVAGIFLEKEAQPKLIPCYGGIKGAYSVGGIKTYKISSPRYLPDEGAMLEFDAYSTQTGKLKASVDIAGEDGEMERYTCRFAVRGGGKWKRVVLTANDFKSESFGSPLKSFALGSALIFDCENKENVFAVTNILWL